MKRLIIIGNGFDLAHGIKSKFGDFVDDYIYKALTDFNSHHNFKDDLLNIKLSNNLFTDIGLKNLTINETQEKFQQLLQNKEVIVSINSELLNNTLLTYQEKRWVDIEQEFFNLLKLHVKSGWSLQKLNEQFDYLKIKLQEYLTSLDKSFLSELYEDRFVEIFIEPIRKQELILNQLKKDLNPNELFFLNFNYTNTLTRYVNASKPYIPSIQKQIHGELNSKINPIIFGFGDEFDKDYIDFENRNNNEIYRHIKSFDYLKTDNYYSLIRFIDSDEFQVQIFGHSCGLSDRTMLNQIFEHDNCRSIKIFFHKNEKGENDFTERTNEISRHFNNKSMLRKKIVPLNLSKEMPQPIKN